MFTIGIRAHDLGKQSLEDLARSLSELGLSTIQLALRKALSDPIYQPGRLSPGFASRVRRVLEAHGIQIAVLGAYMNLIHPEPQQREKELSVFTEHLRYAREFGASLVGSETGHRSPDGSPHPDTQAAEAFADLIISVRKLCQQAEAYGALVGIEPVAEKHPLSSIERTAKLIEAVDSPALQIIFDPVNLAPDKGLENQTDFFRSAFQAFGSRIACIHAKDYVVQGGKKVAVPSGQGDLDYAEFFSILKEEKPGIHIILEQNRPETLAAALAYVRKFSEIEG